MMNASGYKEKINDSAYKTADLSHRKIQRERRNLSVRDMVNVKVKKHSEFGVQGYHIPKYNPYLDKPLGRKWMKGNIPSFWDSITNSARKANSPSPDHYQK